MTNRFTLLLGGARSGKSRYAEDWARENGERVLFVATAQAFDGEMRERIAAHRRTRPVTWDTLEAPLNAGAAIQRAYQGHEVVVVDCMTLLASNAMLRLPDDSDQQAATDAITAEADALVTAYRQTGGQWLVVTNEVGMGVVPPTKLGRYYRDALGRANQQLAAAADDVFLFVAGLPWQLKGGD